MIISIKSKQNLDISTEVLDKILTISNESLNDYVERIIICDEEDLESEINLWDDTITITKLIGCTVNGKTISHSNKSIIFITTNILINLYNNIVVKENANVIYKDESFNSLRTIFHEIGHAKRHHDYGTLNIRKVYDTYDEMLNGHWQIVRDEYFAEMNCSNIIKLEKSIDWYGGFTDNIEFKNFESYVGQYIDQYSNFNSHLAMQFLHNYYLIPLFHKAGFYEGASKFINLENINVCSRIQDIQMCHVIENDYVPKEYNDIILALWEEFRIEDKIKSNS